MKTQIIILMCLCGFIQACNQAARESAPETIKPNPDAEPLNVISRVPADSTDIAVDSVISITFDQPVNMATVNEESFAIPGVSGEFSYDEQTYTISFKPDHLRYTTDYQLTLNNNILSSEGGQLKTQYQWEFRTELIGRFAFVANRNSQSVSTYGVGRDGNLRHLRYTPGFIRPTSAIADPLGRFLYVGDEGLNNGEPDKLHGFAIDAVTGELEAVPGSPFDLGERPFISTIHPNGKFLYMPNSISSTISAFAIDETDGSLDLIASYATGTNYPSIVVISPDGRSLYATDFQGGVLSAFAVDTQTGQLSVVEGSPYEVIQPGSPAAQTLGIAVSPDSRFVYVSNFGLNSISIFAVDETSRRLSLTEASPVATGTNPYGMRMHPDGNYLYVAIYGEAKIEVYEVNTQSGALQAAATPEHTVPNNPAILRFDPLNRFMYVGRLSGHTFAAFTLADNGDLNPLDKVSSRQPPFDMTVAAGIGPVDFTASYAYVVNGNGTIQQHDISPDGGLTHVGDFSTIADPLYAKTDRTGRYLYVSNDGSMDIFAIDNDGNLNAIPGTPLTIPASNNGFQLESSGRFLYFGGNNSGTIYGYHFDTNTNQLLALETSPYDLGTPTGPMATTINSHGRYVYGANFSDGLIFTQEVNTTTGELTDLGLASQQEIPGLRLLFAGAGGQFIFGLVDGTPPSLLPFTIENATLVPGTAANLPDGAVVHDVLTDDRGDRLYVAVDYPERTDQVLTYTISPTDGSLTAADSDDTGTNPVALTIHPNNQWLYVANRDDNTLSRFQITTNGTLEFKDNVGNMNAPSAISIPMELK